MSAAPPILYGTAWKEDATRELVALALQTGFRGFDTANQRRHYVEAAVGDAIREAIDQGRVRREELFLQTKFTFRAGQDHRLPYDSAAPIAQQVEQSFENSLQHLRADAVEAYLLHGPSRRVGLGPDDWAAWQAMEGLQQRGAVQSLGISNVSLEQLQRLCREARVAPRFVQNRCFAAEGWDRGIRQFCGTHDIIYQGFSLLTANQGVLRHSAILNIAKRLSCTVCQVIFCFAEQIGILPLTGTSSPTHMREDLAAQDLELTPEEVQRIEHIAISGGSIS